MTTLTPALLCASLPVESVRSVIERLGLAGKTRSRDDLVTTLTGSPSATLPAILDLLSRANLKELCRACGLDDSGKEKAPIVARLLVTTADPSTPTTLRPIAEDIPNQVAADKALQNAMKNTPTTARDEHDRALNRVMTAVLKDDTQLVKMFFDDPGFRRWLADQVFRTIAKAG